MAHKTLIGGTAYDVAGGKALVNGTAYEITGGKALVDGTGRAVAFRRPIPVYISGDTYNPDYGDYYGGVTINGNYYTDSDRGNIDEYVFAGDVIDLTAQGMYINDDWYSMYDWNRSDHPQMVQNGYVVPEGITRIDIELYTDRDYGYAVHLYITTS